jgi:transposase
MSKHSVSAGDIAALRARFSELRRKACTRTGKSFPIVVIQEAGLDGLWIHRVLLSALREEQSFDPVDVLNPFHDQHLTLATDPAAIFIFRRRRPNG